MSSLRPIDAFTLTNVTGKKILQDLPIVANVSSVLLPIACSHKVGPIYQFQIESCPYKSNPLIVPNYFRFPITQKYPSTIIFFWPLSIFNYHLALFQSTSFIQLSFFSLSLTSSNIVHRSIYYHHQL